MKIIIIKYKGERGLSSVFIEGTFEKRSEEWMIRWNR